MIDACGTTAIGFFHSFHSVLVERETCSGAPRTGVAGPSRATLSAHVSAPLGMIMVKKKAPEQQA